MFFMGLPAMIDDGSASAGVYEVFVTPTQSRRSILPRCREALGPQKMLLRNAFSGPNGRLDEF
jgi:hypothetical protein